MHWILVLTILSVPCLAQQVTKAFVLQRGEGTRYDLGSAIAVMKVTTEETGGRWSMVDFTANPGMQTILHQHRVTDETFSVLEGELTMSVDGRVHTLHPGDVAIVPKMTPHAFANLSGKPVRFLGTATPAGFEKFFALVAEEVKVHKPGTPEFQSAMIQINKQVDMEPLGPPPFGQAGASAH
jgi:quercetin dioxygenase-like cupin family protein